MLDVNVTSWLCWIFPIVGAFFAILLENFNRKVRAIIVTIFSFLAWLMAAFMIPELLTPRFVDKTVFWISLPNNTSIDVGTLIDPLSIILANLVSFLGFIIMVYSIKYMEDKPGELRYWFFMSLFIGSMLLLVLADNLILFFVGWKIVGFCSYALIGHYYSDEKKYWIGGPSPFSFQKPSKCGLKALLVTTFGDTLLLAGIIILYLYSGTFNFIELHQTANLWLAKMAANPGMLALTSALLLAGPIAKSAQFPLHEWLPEAMAGPTPVSALIHAATMVKAGVYFVARMLPTFFYAYWIMGCPEASTFFILAATLGAFTAFLTGTQAMVSLELKKVLAYSTMSQIGYMMLALGVAGLNMNALTCAFSAGIFHLISHGAFKAALFLCAGALIHVSGSIYISEMKLSRRVMGLTWLFMWLASLSLMGVPPLSGFWSKDDILISCLQSGRYVLFVIAFVTVAITCFYTMRFMGIIFHEEGGNVESEAAEKKLGPLMFVPYGILAVLTLALGLIGPWFGGFLHETFERYFVESLKLMAVSHGVGVASAITLTQPSAILNILIPASSIVMIIVGATPAYKLYISHGWKPEEILDRHAIIKKFHSFFWNRWYIDAFYNKVFVKGTLLMRNPLLRFIENPIDYALNMDVPKFLAASHRYLRKVQTGVLSINMLYMTVFLAFVMFILLWLGGML